MKKWTAGG